MQPDLLKLLTNSEVQSFLGKYEEDDPLKLLFKKPFFPGILNQELVNQLVSRKKSKHKLPEWYKARQIVYPPPLSIEQASSSKTAQFKSQLFNGKNLLDLTGGFGVDAYFFSKQFDSLDFVEPQENLVRLAKHNHQVLGSSQFNYFNSSAEEFLNNNSKKYDLIYLDPSRRKSTGRAFRFQDCEPNVIKLLDSIKKYSNLILIKASPMLDIKAGLNDLDGASKIWVVSVKNECRELLFLIGDQDSHDPEIETVDIRNGQISKFPFKLSDEKKQGLTGEVKSFIYDANSSILKAGAFNSISNRFNLTKISRDAHLYSSDQHINSFPGRVFKVMKPVKPSDLIQGTSLNVISKNYPLSAERIISRYQLKRGGNVFLIATRDRSGKKIMMLTKKIST